jgi:hypothetical protein
MLIIAKSHIRQLSGNGMNTCTVVTVATRQHVYRHDGLASRKRSSLWRFCMQAHCRIIKKTCALFAWHGFC